MTQSKPHTTENFWSRRRAAVAEEARTEVALAEAEVAAEHEAALAERNDADLLAEQGLPEPEALDSPEAVREFLNSALPQRLKTRALRRLWRLNPVLANLDGLVDYGEDFTDAATVVENMQTAYQVGKGMLKHVEEMARQAEAKLNGTEEDMETEAQVAASRHEATPAEATRDETAADDGPDTEVAMVDDALAMTSALAEHVTFTEHTPPADPLADPLADEQLALAPSRRRMQFSFETTPARAVPDGATK